ncbi:hypothetical protein YC2023_099675 [Brassica napus]
MFKGSCKDRGSPSATCFLDFLGARSASEMPKNCHCTPKPKNMRLCECQVVCKDCWFDGFSRLGSRRSKASKGQSKGFKWFSESKSSSS